MRDSILALGTLATLMTQDLAHFTNIGQNPLPPDSDNPATEAENQPTEAIPVANVLAVHPESHDFPSFVGDRPSIASTSRPAPRLAPMENPVALAPVTTAITSQPITTEPTTPQPITPESATPQPITPEPATPQPITPHRPTAKPMQAESALSLAIAPSQGQSAIAATSNASMTPRAIAPVTALTNIQTHPKAHEITTLAEKGVVEGYQDGTFRPDSYVTETEFSQMMQKAFSRSPEATPLFERPSGVVTRAEAAEFVYQKLLAAQAIATDAPTSRSPAAMPSTPVRTEWAGTLPPRNPVAIPTPDSSPQVPQRLNTVATNNRSDRPAPVVPPTQPSNLAPQKQTQEQEQTQKQAQEQAQAQAHRKLQQKLGGLTGTNSATSVSTLRIGPIPPTGGFSAGQSVQAQHGPGLDVAIAPAPAPVTPERTGDRQSAGMLRVSVMGAVNHPGLVQLPLNASLTTVVQAAGGFREPNASHSLELIRLNDNGTITHRTIQVDPTPSDPAPMALRNDDVVIVKPQTSPLCPRAQGQPVPLVMQLLDTSSQPALE